MIERALLDRLIADLQTLVDQLKWERDGAPADPLWSDLQFSVRTYNCICDYLEKKGRPNNSLTASQLASIPDSEFLRTRKLGKKTLREIRTVTAPWKRG